MKWPHKSTFDIYHLTFSLKTIMHGILDFPTELEKVK